MKTLTKTFAFKIVVVAAVLGSVTLAVRLFAQEECPDATAITSTFVLEFKQPARLKKPDDGSDMYANFGKVLNVADAEGKNGTCVFIRPFDGGDKIKAPPFDNIRTAAAATAKKTPSADGSIHVTQTPTDAIKETLASAHVTQRIATNSPDALAKVLACFAEPTPPEKPATATPKSSPSATPSRPKK